MAAKKTKKCGTNIITCILVLIIIATGLYLGKKGIEKFLILNQETKNINNLIIPENIKTELDTTTEEKQWAYLYKEHPELLGVKFPAGILYDYALLYAENPNTVGFLNIPGTNINNPVVQTADDEYYRTHDFYNKSTSYGAIFAASYNDMQNLDQNTLLYGHNMRDGSRFAELAKYKSPEFFKEHPVIQFDTLFEKQQWVISKVAVVSGTVDPDDSKSVNFLFNNYSNDEFETFVNELNKHQLYETGIDLQSTDKILTLCTCSYEFNNARLIVVARQVREGETVN